MDVETLSAESIARFISIAVNMSGNGYVLQLHAIAIYALGLVRKRAVVTDSVDPSAGDMENLCSSYRQPVGVSNRDVFRTYSTVQWNV